mmetsp:Transcript_106859/g.189909  ORF Transcript_106859/g.189909 Transcript_106859/m.189909 type:complete len:280 (+) Transcript_106859:1141-1980(+)
MRYLRKKMPSICMRLSSMRQVFLAADDSMSLAASFFLKLACNIQGIWAAIFSLSGPLANTCLERNSSSVGVGLRGPAPNSSTHSAIGACKSSGPVDLGGTAGLGFQCSELRLLFFFTGKDFPAPFAADLGTAGGAFGGGGHLPLPFPFPFTGPAGADEVAASAGTAVPSGAMAELCCALLSMSCSCFSKTCSSASDSAGSASMSFSSSSRVSCIKRLSPSACKHFNLSLSTFACSLACLSLKGFISATADSEVPKAGAASRNSFHLLTSDRSRNSSCPA